MAIPFLKSKVPGKAPADDPLAQFEAEAGQPAGQGADEDLLDAGLPVADGISKPLTLATVVALGTPVFWPEAIAIVEAVCRELTPEEGTELPAPEPTEILLHADGSVQVRTGFTLGRRSDSVSRLARTLHALTSGQATPAPLRLLISKWVVSDGSHAIADFCAELAYFARPEGAQLVRDVYQRCMSAAVVARAAKAPVAAPAGHKPAEMQTPRPPAAKRAPRRGRGVAVAAVVAGLAALGAGLLVSSARASGDGNSPDLLATLMARASEFAKALGEVRFQVGEIQAELTEHLRSEEEGGAAARPAAPAAGVPGRARGGVRPSRGTAAAARGGATTAAAPAPAGSIAAAAAAIVAGATGPAAPATSTPPESSASPAPAAETAARAAAPAAVVSGDPDALYSNADEDVNPPRMLYPHVPPVPLKFSTTDEVNVMEIVVGSSGAVERVRLTSPARRMTDMMLLSSAKSWKFSPASKDGQAVRYRMALSWTTTQ